MASDGESILALECFSFTVSEAEAAGIHIFLTDNDCEPNSQGLKKFLLIHSGLEESKGEREDGDGLSRGVARLAEALKRNPEVAESLKREGARIAGSFMRKVAGL